ncbi:hypothetical protein BDM02DRAFT_3257307 [Thelephora ganbajun]|uniref:Uncharacterized protein n=1 Tax=Thelephora ganbajun TaxID=370292 RepID=A0ACB6ZY02_THEGA|nr:hypothetical protein BDM02DRAFT_3257307 [Thelephora ganbajun]
MSTAHPPTQPPSSSNNAAAKQAATTTPRPQPTRKLPPTEMPPPPLPQKKILENEVTALSNCFRSAVVNTAQIYRFHHQTRRLGIHHYAPGPPRSLTASLGREIEKFDQLCDALESRLLRAIAVLQRDLRREHERLQAALASQPPSKPTSPVFGTLTIPTSPLQPHSAMPDQSPLASRRQSAVALSSLQRPSFPHKLDLSSLRMNPEDLISLSASGMTSPVTLAPRTARPSTTTSEIPPDLMAAIASSEAAAASRPVDIDLTLDSDSAVGPQPISLNIDPTLGGSADKPIELDLDIDMEEMSGIFGPEPPRDGVETLFSPAEDRVKVEEIFPDFSAVENAGRDLFQSIGAATSQGSGHLHPAGVGQSPFDLASIDLGGIDQSFLLQSNSDMTLMDELYPSTSALAQGASGGTS